MEIPNFLLQKIEEVIEYIGDTTSDYLAVKRQLLSNFPNSSRSLFSTRHHKTKKHILNGFDHAVIAYWEKRTGIKLQIDPNKLHNPVWVYKKKGWALELINKKRKQDYEVKRSLK